MEIIGKVFQLGNVVEGTSARGPWKKQELIIETVEQFPRKVCLSCWGDRVAEAANFAIGQMIKAQISIESREFNGKWYTDVRPFRFDNAETATQVQPQAKPQPQMQPQHTSQPMPQFSQTQPEDFAATDNGDDLPF